MKSRGLIGISVLIVAATTFLWWLGRPSPTIRKQSPPSADTEKVKTSSASREGPHTPSPREEELLSAAGGLAAARTAEEQTAALERLRQTLASGATNETVDAIRRVLDTKMDGPTGKGFKVGGKGALVEAPTLRTMLLDQLGQLDPAAAAAYARTILDGSDSADEWAVALRNLARGDASPDARALLSAKMDALLRNTAWQQEASVGYLEAFDTAVYLGGKSLLPPLTDLVRKQDNQAVAHAAFLALDRMVFNQPAETLSELEQHGDWMQGREQTRADYFARANVGDDAQRRIVEAYLLDPTRSAAELQAFAGVFPNANFMISQNLLTDNATLDGAALRQRDLKSLEVVNQWLADPRFQDLRPTLSRMQQRLQGFVSQAAR